MTTAEVLQKARDLIADESRWTHGKYARDALGEDVEPTSPEACKFCALGALLAVSGAQYEEEDDLPSIAALRAVCPVDERGRRRRVPSVNDLDGHAAVLALFDEAIAKAQA